MAKQVLDNDAEYCVVCQEITPYTKNTAVDLRKGYVDGAGQLYQACWNKIYEKTVTIDRQGDLVTISRPGYRFSTKVDRSFTNEQIRIAVSRLLATDLFNKMDVYFKDALLGKTLPTQREIDIIDHDLVGIVS